MSFLGYRWLLVVFLTASVYGSPATPARTAVQAKGSCSDGPKEFHLRAGEQYAARGMLQDAEKEYLSAGESKCPDIRKGALEGLGRLFNTADNGELDLGRFYESQGMWKEAEEHYVNAAKEPAPPAQRRAATDGLWRVRNGHTPGLTGASRYTESIAAWGSIFARFGAVIVFAWIVSTIVLAIVGRWQAFVVLPFDGDKDSAERIAVAFPAVRARVASMIGPTAPIFLPDVVQIVYPFVSPRFDEMLPDEQFEIAGVKIPNVNKFLAFFARPRFEVRGGVLRADNCRLLYAEVWRRRWWLSSRLATSVTRHIAEPDSEGAEVELFVYDVYLNTHATL